MHTVVEQKKKEAIKNTRIEKECNAKERAEKEQCESQKSDKSPSPEIEEDELLGQGEGGDEGQGTPFILKKCGKEKKGGTRKK